MDIVTLGQLLASYNFVGYTGSQGTDGYTGSRGAGFTGSKGADGVIGVDGYTGSKGNSGYTGSAGPQGVQGYTGSAATGVVGYSGSASGSAIAGDLFVEGTLTVNNTILPTTSNIIDIGSPELRFGAIYLAGNTIDLGGTQITSDANGELVFTTQAGNISLNANTINFLSSVADTSQTAGDFTITGNVTAGSYYFANGQPLSGGVGYTGSAGIGFTGSQGLIGYTGSAGAGGGGGASAGLATIMSLIFR